MAERTGAHDKGGQSQETQSGGADSLVRGSDVDAAASRVRAYVHDTALMTCAAIDGRAGRRVWLKCENFQKTGSFKARGAVNTVAQLSQEERERGVITHSSGNHAQALAYAASVFGIEATVVMPTAAPMVKRAATKAYGARIVDCAPTLAAREEVARRVIEETGAVLVHPYDDARIIAGAGTAAREALAKRPDCTAVLAPVGGGGLLSGTTLAVRDRGGSDRLVVGCEPAGADDAARGLERGYRVTVEEHHPHTVADGLLTTLGERNFEVLERFRVPIVTVADDEILDAMRFAWERAKLLIEPSSAVPLAALFGGQAQDVLPDDDPVIVIVSGGNVDVRALAPRLPM